jgi:VanZ family protein
VNRAHDLVRWSAALLWTALVCALMLLPGRGTVVEDTSRAAGGTDLTDAIGHVILFGILAGLWWGALAPRRGWSAALRIALGVALVLGLLAEAGQSLMPDRGVSLLDFLANELGAVVAAGCVIYGRARETGAPGARWRK